MKDFFKAVLHFTLLLVAVFSLSSCVSKQKGAPNSNSIWKFETKIQVTDKVKNESQTASVDVFAHAQNFYRFEISGSLGYQVASALIRRNAGREALTYVLYAQKVYAVEPMSARAMRPIFNQSIDPNLLIDLIEDRQLKGYDLLCGRQTDFAIKCTNDEMQIVAERGQAKEPSRDNSFVKRITIESEKYRLVWVFKSQDYENEYSNETLAQTFVLEPPDDFKRIQIK